MLMSTNQNICSLVWLKFQNLAMTVMEMAYEPKVYTLYTLYRDLFIIAQISNLCGGHRDHMVSIYTQFLAFRMPYCPSDFTYLMLI
jgi:hypothetical protein